jgi:hypothetical protein
MRVAWGDEAERDATLKKVAMERRLPKLGEARADGFVKYERLCDERAYRRWKMKLVVEEGVVVVWEGRKEKERAVAQLKGMNHDPR